MWTDVVPATDASDADITAHLLPEARLRYFNTWVDGLGVPTEKYDDNIQQLENQ